MGINKQQVSRIIGIVGLAGVSIALLALVGGFIRLGINISDSLPGTLVAIVKQGAITTGDTIAFHPSSSLIHPARDVLIKKIVGVAGDEVRQQDNIYFVNDDLVGFALGQTRNKVVLHPGPIGKIPAKHYFVASSHPYSFDSRYAEIGWVADEQIMGRVIVLW